MRERDKPEGWNLVERATTMLGALTSDLFRLPGAAQNRAIAARERFGEDHGDDLLCGCWAAAEEATALLELMGRHIDAIVRLAAVHPGYASTAQTLARAAVEHGLRIQWLLQPDTARERETRWLALKAEELRLYQALPGLDSRAIREIEAQIEVVEEFTGLERPPGTPSIESLAKEFTPSGRLYTLYRLMSQSTHGTSIGAGSFHIKNRAAWNAAGGEGEWIEAELWSPALIGSWEAASGAAGRYHALLAPDQSVHALSRDSEFYKTVYSIPANFQAREALATRPPKAQPMNRSARRAAERRKPRDG